jgi:hypothetical protein
MPQTATEATQTPALLEELSVEQFGQWRRHPVTELVFDRYFDDFLGTLERGIMDAWLAGTLSLQVEQDARGYVHSLRHLQGITLQMLRSFYNVEHAAPAPKRQDSGTGY